MEVGAVGNGEWKQADPFGNEKSRWGVKILQQNFHSGRGSRRQRERVRDINFRLLFFFFLNFFYRTQNARWKLI